jgi:signal transduction histidine kinase
MDRATVKAIGLKNLAIFGSMLLITAAHYAMPPSLFWWHEIFERLYYLPIIVGAVSFGWAGGLLAALCAGICYLPHVVTAWQGSPQALAAKFAEIVVFLAVGATTGILSDRERKRSRELQKTTDRLQAVYKDLENSFEQLIRAGRLAAVGQLAASLAHEIRNPLASIEGAVDIVERTAKPERQAEFLGVIKKETLRLKDLLTRLLNFARPQPPQIRPAKIEEIIESVVQLTAHEARQLDIELNAELAVGLPTVECDGEQIRQVLLNLILNALQANSKGGRVMVSARQQCNQMLLQVVDEGCGIEEADLEKIFDPFYTTKEGGTGLGLAISYQIVAQHGGSITAKKNAGRGMTFDLVLPLLQTPSR